MRRGLDDRLGGRRGRGLASLARRAALAFWPCSSPSSCCRPAADGDSRTTTQARHRRVAADSSDCAGCVKRSCAPPVRSRCAMKARAFASKREQFVSAQRVRAMERARHEFCRRRLEGLEVAFIVLAFGRSRRRRSSGRDRRGRRRARDRRTRHRLHRPLLACPENALKLLVGIMLSGIGTFWLIEGFGMHWPSELVIRDPDRRLRARQRRARSLLHRRSSALA